MNFFQQLNALQVEGDWQINIKSSSKGAMLVSILFINDKTGDAARKLIPPMILKGTVQELDEGFFSTIENPVKKTAALFVNMEEYLKAQATAKEQSKMEQDKKQQEGKNKIGIDKKYETQMKKVDELEEAGKFREAYGQLPKATDFPDHEEEINERKEELAEKFDQTGLFANP
jgi:PRTRC genetic system protein E